jgi:protein TonB
MQTLHDESQSESHLERAHLERPVPHYAPGPPDATEQRKRMLIALGILLVALAAVILKDWDFWFPPNGDGWVAGVRISRPQPPQPQPTPAEPENHEHKAAKAPGPAPAPAPAPMTAVTQRAVLPPLEVEVVSGNQHISVPARSTAIHLDAGSGPSISSGTVSGSSAPSVASAGRVQLSPQVAQRVAVSVTPDYPLLARQMKVQGAVSLQALIARDGTIQELEILSGPDILAAAAREAVKQWHFKPYLQNGQPVETQARITVNFTISTN